MPPPPLDPRMSTWSSKNDLFIYFIEQNVNSIHILFFDCYVPSLLCVNKVYKEILQFWFLS